MHQRDREGGKEEEEGEKEKSKERKRNISSSFEPQMLKKLTLKQ